MLKHVNDYENTATRWMRDDLEALLAQETPRKVPARIAWALRSPLIIVGAILFAIGLLIMVPAGIILHNKYNTPWPLLPTTEPMIMVGIILLTWGIWRLWRRVNVLRNGICGSGKIKSITLLPMRDSGEGFLRVVVTTETGDTVSSIVPSLSIEPFFKILDTSNNAVDVIYIPGRKICVLPLALMLRARYRNHSY